MNGEKELLTNDLAISVDWLSWTFKDAPSVEYVVNFMGYDMSSFHLLPKGASGYRSQLRHTGLAISILYDGSEDMGIHIDVSGSAIANLVQHYHDTNMCPTPFGASAYSTTSFDYTVFTDMLSEIIKRGQITRLDIAIDDIGERYYSLDELHNIFVQKHYVSKFRSWREISEHDNKYYKTGHTIYFGSRSSNIMFRVYDKRLEQISKKQVLEADLSPWVRWEIELKTVRAMQTASLLVAGDSLGNVAIGILSNYFRVIEPDNVRLDRCSTSPKWNEFINSVSAIRLYLPTAPKTLEQTRSWLMKQVAPSFSAVIKASGGDMDFAYKMLASGSNRINGGLMSRKSTN